MANYVIMLIALQNLVDTSADDRVIVQAKGALWKLQESKGNKQISKVVPKSGRRLYCLQYFVF